MHLIRKIDLDSAAMTLSAAFRDYPLFSLVLPDRCSREKKMLPLMNFILRLGLLHGEVIADSPDLRAVSIWLPFPRPATSLRDVLRSGYLSLNLRLSREELGRFVSVSREKAEARKHLWNDRHLFLDMIGTAPGCEKRGLGTAMLRSRLDRADAEGTACCVETSLEENVAFYERFGFREVLGYELGGMAVHCMRREAGARQRGRS